MKKKYNFLKGICILYFCRRDAMLSSLKDMFSSFKFQVKF